MKEGLYVLGGENAKNGMVAGKGCLHSSGIPWPVVENISTTTTDCDGWLADAVDSGKV